MSTFKVVDMKAVILDRGLYSSKPVPAHTARIVHESGSWLGVSRYTDEDEWVADCHFGANGFPFFSNGTGTRLTARQVVSDWLVVAALDEAALYHPLSPI